MRHGARSAAMAVASVCGVPSAVALCEQRRQQRSAMFRRLTASADASSELQIFQPRLQYPYWDPNWDHRELDANGLPRTDESGRVRHILLVQHGQGDAEATGRRVREMTRGAGRRVRCVHSAPGTTTKSFADTIASGLPRSEDPQLEEGVPAQSIPGPPQHSAVVYRDGSRLEAAFRRYFKRSLPRDETDLDTHDDSFRIDDDECTDEYDVVVCDANVVRYFFLRSLQLPPEAWLRLATSDCSITHITISQNGLVSAQSLGETAHLTNHSS